LRQKRLMADMSFASFDDLRSPDMPSASLPVPEAPDPACPHCHAASLQRSRLRWYERWRKVGKGQRPFRCASCGRRVWLAPAPEHRHVDIPVAAEAVDFDLRALDVDWSDSPAQLDWPMKRSKRRDRDEPNF